MNDLFETISGLFLVLVFAGIPVASWLTHVITCIQTEAWGFLIAGAIFFPVGMVHGIGLWIGVW